MSSPGLSGANAFVLQTQVEAKCMGSNPLTADFFFTYVGFWTIVWQNGLSILVI